MTRKTVLLSVIEQGFTSLAMLAMTAGLIATSTPDVFGQFAVVITLVMIAASLQYGLVGVPLLVEVSPLAGAARAEALGILYAFDLHYRIGCAGVVGAAAYAVSHDVGVAGAGAGFTLAYLWRETTRNALFATGEAPRAAAIALTSFLLLMGLLAVLLTAGSRPTPAAPLVAGALSMVMALGVFSRYRIEWPGSPGAALRAYRTRFPATGWTLANSAANEIQTRAHVIVVQLLRGADQVGVLEAARVLFSPLLLLSGAWQRVVQPRLAAHLAGGDVAAARKLTLAGVAGICIVSLAYCAIVAVAFDIVSARLFGDRYGDMTLYAVAWAVYATLLVANWTLVSFMKASRAYRRVAMISATAALATGLLLLLLAFDVPLISALIIPIAIQACVLIALMTALWRPVPEAIRAQGVAA